MRQHEIGLPSEASRQRLIGALLRRVSMPPWNPRSITPDDAEKRAQRSRCELSRTPGPDEHDPQAEDYWTLPMAVAWVATGSLQAVREQSEPYTAECIDWQGGQTEVFEVPRTHQGPPCYRWIPWHLAPRERPSAFRLTVEDLTLSPGGPDYDWAWKRLLRELRRPDGIVATGRQGAAPRRAISPVEWIDLELRDYRDTDVVAPELGSAILIDDPNVRFTNILISQKGLLREFLDPTKTQSKKRGRRPKLDAATVVKIVAELMEHHGALSPDDPIWNAQADLERAVGAKLGIEVAESTLRGYVSEALSAWGLKAGK